MLRAERCAGGVAAAHGDAAHVPVRAPRTQLAARSCHVLPPAHAPGMCDHDDDDDYYDHTLLQDLPSHVIMLSLLAISLERWRVITPRSSNTSHNTNTRTKINMKMVLPIIWLLSSLLVLPYAKFISHFYLDVRRNLLTFHSQTRRSVLGSAKSLLWDQNRQIE